MSKISNLRQEKKNGWFAQICLGKYGTGLHPVISIETCGWAQQFPSTNCEQTLIQGVVGLCEMETEMQG